MRPYDFIDSLAGPHRLRLVPLRFLMIDEICEACDSLAGPHRRRLVPLRFLMIYEICEACMISLIPSLALTVSDWFRFVF